MNPKTTKPENLRLWVEALRSGEFEQGTGYLRFGDKFCCLGVACEVAVRNGLDIQVLRPWDSAPDEVTYDGNSACIPRSVSDWLGLPRGHVWIYDQDSGLDRTAVNVNDSQGWTFPQIADALEASYLKPMEVPA